MTPAVEAAVANFRQALIAMAQAQADFDMADRLLERAKDAQGKAFTLVVSSQDKAKLARLELERAVMESLTVEAV